MKVGIVGAGAAQFYLAKIEEREDPGQFVEIQIWEGGRGK